MRELLYQVIAATAAVTLAVLPLGWHLGYHAIGGYFLFWLLMLAAVWSGVSIAAGAFTWTGWAGAAIRAGVVAFAAIVACGFALGLAGFIGPAGYAGLALASLAAGVMWGRSRAPIEAPRLPSPHTLVLGLCAALVAFMIGYAAAHAPLTLYDAVSYHLFFPARWLQDRHLAIIATPFSDPAQAYAPGNGELFLLWLMVPFHGDLLARMGQLPFAVFGAIALYAISRQLGADRERAAYPALFWLLSRSTVEQAVGANVDVMCATMFLAGLYLGIEAVRRDEKRDWLLWGVALGLYWGTKYVSLVYTPVLLVFLFVGRLKPAPTNDGNGGRKAPSTPVLKRAATRLLWALPGIAALALPWYVRNWIVAGSPIYPSSLAVAGLTLAQGAYDRTAMLNTIFHTTDVRLFPVIAAKAFGPTLALVWVPAAVVGGVALARRGWWPYACIALLPYCMALLDWFGFPVNIDARFLMPAVGPALLCFAFVFGRSAVWSWMMRVVYALAAIWIVVGARTEIPASTPWFMGGWLALHGIVTPAFVAWFFVAAVAFAAMAWLVARISSGAALVAAASVITGVVLGVGADRWCGTTPCAYLDTTSPFIRPNLLVSWRWIDNNVRDSTIAYTGINLPYPLSGTQLANRVVYVNIDGRDRWRFHDYDRAYRRHEIVTRPPVLATSSGELLSVPQHPEPHPDASRPRYERMQGARNAWEASLRRTGVRHLYISALSAYEIDNVWHNAAGFPIEDDWARANPELFHLVYENPQVRIYVLALPGRTRA